MAPVTNMGSTTSGFAHQDCINPTMAIQQLLTEYKQRAKRYFLNNSQCSVHTFQVWSMDPQHQSPGV